MSPVERSRDRVARAASAALAGASPADWPRALCERGAEVAAALRARELCVHRDGERRARGSVVIEDVPVDLAPPATARGHVLALVLRRRCVVLLIRPPGERWSEEDVEGALGLRDAALTQEALALEAERAAVDGAGGASHALVNTLQAMLGFTELARDRALRSLDVGRALDCALRAADDALRLARRLPASDAPRPPLPSGPRPRTA